MATRNKKIDRTKQPKIQLVDETLDHLDFKKPRQPFLNLHQMVYDHLKPSQIKAALKRAKTLGLLDIPNVEYALIKASQKDPGKLAFFPNRAFIGVGQAALCSDGVEVWLYHEDNRLGWFKSSPIVKVKKIAYGYQIETENSYYELTTTVRAENL